MLRLSYMRRSCPWHVYNHVHGMIIEGNLLRCSAIGEKIVHSPFVGDTMSLARLKKINIYVACLPEMILPQLHVYRR